jgi:YHS domain-containing protein
MRQLFLSMALIIAGSVLHAQEDAALRTKYFNLDKGIALSGYDVVAYMKQNKAVKGTKDLAATYEGVTYYFATAADRDEFNKNPAMYEPQYGGWCAYAMGKKGEKVNIDPGTFKIVNGKLYLFYNKYFNNTLTDWNKDEVNLKSKADANWQKLYH